MHVVESKHSIQFGMDSEQVKHCPSLRRYPSEQFVHVVELEHSIQLLIASIHNEQFPFSR